MPSSSPPEPAELPVALRTRYQDPHLLGRGAFGVVYRVRDLQRDQLAALKLLDPIPGLGSEKSAELVARFQREAELAARIDSPRVVAVLDHGRVEEQLYIVHQLVDGMDACAVIAAYPQGIPLEAVVRILDDVLTGLAAAHLQGIVHRDLKPANVLVTREGRALVADFGLARHVESFTLTRTGLLVGTPLYASPEQFETGESSPASDVYAAALLAAELLTGRRVFQAGDLLAVLENKRNFVSLDLGACTAPVPAALHAFLDGCLAWDPGDRPGDGGAALEALRQIAGGGKSGARTTAPLPRASLQSGSVSVSVSATGPVAGSTSALHSTIGPESAGSRRLLLGGLFVVLLVAGAMLGGDPATQGPGLPGAPPVPSAAPAPDAAPLAAAVSDLLEIPEIEAALALTTNSPDPVETWRTGRSAFRGEMERVIPLLEPFENAPLSPTWVAEVTRLRVVERLFEDTGLDGVGPLYGPGQGSPLAALAARPVGLLTEPLLAGNWPSSPRETRAIFMEAEGRAGRAHIVIRRAEDLELKLGGKDIFLSGLVITNHYGDRFEDPAAATGNAGLIGESLYETGKVDRDIVPSRLLWEIPELDGDLLVTLDVQSFWDTSVPILTIKGVDEDVPFTFELPFSSPDNNGTANQYERGLRLAIHRDALPRGARRIELRAEGLQPIGRPHRHVRLREVFVQSAGEPPEELRFR